MGSGVAVSVGVRSTGAAPVRVTTMVDGAGGAAQEQANNASSARPIAKDADRPHCQPSEFRFPRMLHSFANQNLSGDRP